MHEPRRRLSARVWRFTAWAVLVLTVIAEVASAWMEYLRQTAVGTPDLGQLVGNQAFGLVLLPFVFVGAVIVSRTGGHLVGWLFLATSMDAFYGVLDAYARLAVATQPVLPGARAAALAGALIEQPGPAPVMLLLLVFPTGRLLSHRWRWVVGTVIVWVCVTVMGTALAGGPLPGHPTLSNPIGLDRFPTVSRALLATSGLLPALLFLSCLTAVVLRFRRARGVERQQLKWILLSGGLMVAAFAVLAVATITDTLDTAPGTIFFYAFLLPAILSFPTAAGIAILRHRLYDIDHIISRTVGYAVVTAILGGLYLGLVIGLGSVARVVTGDSGDLVVALSTLAVAAAFRPVRRSVQTAVNRRFNRSSYDAARTVEVYGRSLRDEVDAATIVTGLRATTAATFGASSVGVTLVAGGGAA